MDNKGYAASLEARKIYLAESDAEAEKRGLVRVVDKSGESYLYPNALFRSVELPDDTTKALRLHKPIRMKKKAIRKRAIRFEAA